jgi:hypothetical protein
VIRAVILPSMSVNEALEKALRILDEEQVRLTVSYRYVSDAWPSNKRYQQYELQHQRGWSPAMAALVGLGEERARRPRHVYEDPKLYLFESINFDLLLRIFSQVREEDRAAFVSALLEYVRKSAAARGHRLLAEFFVRTGYLKDLLAATQQPQLPVMSLAELLTELEEMIALNFRLDRLVGQVESLRPGKNAILVVLCGDTNPALVTRFKEKYGITGKAVAFGPGLGVVVKGDVEEALVHLPENRS